MIGKKSRAHRDPLTRQMHGCDLLQTQKTGELSDEKACERAWPSDKNIRITKDEACPLLREVFGGHRDHISMGLGDAAGGLRMTQWWNTFIAYRKPWVPSKSLLTFLTLKTIEGFEPANIWLLSLGSHEVWAHDSGVCRCYIYCFGYQEGQLRTHRI